MGEARVFTWEKEAGAACAALRAEPALLRVISKSKDEEHLLERWILHYLRILGDSARLVILDNMSENQAVLRLYEKYAARLLLIRFSGWHDRVHIVSRFPELYRAVWDSSVFYAFLDTDEFLCLHEDGALIQDQRVPACLEANQDIAFYPAHSLSNAHYREDLFSFKDGIQDILNGIIWGKPLLNARRMRGCIPDQITVGHTAQLPLLPYGELPLGFVILHCSNISINRRIRINMEKIRNSGFIKHHNDFASVLSVDLNSVASDQVLIYIREIRSLLTVSQGQAPPLPETPEHCFRVNKDAALEFYPESLAESFRQYVSNALSLDKLLRQHCAVAYGPDCPIWKIVQPESYRKYHTRLSG